jgi:UDP-N-acetyl-D-glucosamine dehydrogenase
MDRRIQENHKLAQTLKDRFKQKEALIGVIGLGYVGLPICIAAGESGSKVLGFDVDPAKSKAVTQGRSYLNHISDYRIASSQRGAVDRDDVLSRLSEPDALLTCVPTPVTPHLDPDLSFVESTAKEIAAHLRRGQLVILESTTYPGR